VLFDIACHDDLRAFLTAVWRSRLESVGPKHFCWNFINLGTWQIECVSKCKRLTRTGEVEFQAITISTPPIQKDVAA